MYRQHHYHRLNLRRFRVQYQQHQHRHWILHRRFTQHQKFQLQGLGLLTIRQAAQHELHLAHRSRARSRHEESRRVIDHERPGLMDEQATAAATAALQETLAGMLKRKPSSAKTVNVPTADPTAGQPLIFSLEDTVRANLSPDSSPTPSLDALASVSRGPRV